MPGQIDIRGARTNNLKNINVKIPRSKISAVVGVSGAGKSSLAFNTLYAEGYLRYIESISPYIRQFLDRVDKPLVERIEGLPPSISFQYKKPVKNSRSIVATSADIFDYLRILFAKIADFYCPECGDLIRAFSVDEIIAEILLWAGGSIRICFAYEGDVSFLLNRGFYHYIDGDEKKKIDNTVRKKQIDVLLDTIRIGPANKSRIFEAIDRSIAFGKEIVVIYFKSQRYTFPVSLYCHSCDIFYDSADENLFSFNSARGACPDCNGFGDIQALDREKIFDNSKSLQGGAVLPLNSRMGQRYRQALLEFAEEKGIDTDASLGSLTAADLDFIMDGDSTFAGIRGYFDLVRKKSYKVQARVFISRYSSYNRCPECNGSRLNRLARSFKIKGINLADLLAYTIKKAGTFVGQLAFSEYSSKISREVLQDLNARLDYLNGSGLSYLRLNRLTHTLSRGEFQRINLAFIFGANLSDSLLIIDQPSSDLHSIDYEKMDVFLKNLKENGNTVVIIEHNREVVRFADHVIEIGPGAGGLGGRKVFSGPVDRFFNGSSSITQKYFRKPLPPPRSSVAHSSFVPIKNATAHNLKAFNTHFPKNAFTVIVGVSGAGKTSLLREEIYSGDSISGAFQEVVFVESGVQRKNVTTNVLAFFDMYATIREFFAGLRESRLSGYRSGHFSFNSPLGRCDRCKGKGFVEIEMQFLPSVNIKCNQCRGDGFKSEILKIKFNNNNIVDLFNMSAGECLRFLDGALPKVSRILENICDNKMGYLRLGQKLNTLSTGELQRIKLIKFLYSQKKETLFLIDEPSFGLHPYDIELVKKQIRGLINGSHTVIAAEHNLDLIMDADHLIELGPGGGDAGGSLLFNGSLEDLLQSKNSVTGPIIKKKIKPLTNENL